MGSIVAGIDIGSLYTKTVIMSIEGEILAHHIARSGWSYETAGETSLSAALALAGRELSGVDYMVATGYGRRIVPFANEHVTELTCHARATKVLFPNVHTIIDVGGQDSKVIYTDDAGNVTNFVMNDKCAAGTGRFLEVMAEALETDLDEMSEISFQSQEDLEISNVCTVFAETEVISLFASGCSNRADIAAAIHRAISRRILGMTSQLGLREQVAVTGGVAKNKGLVHVLQQTLKTTLLVPWEPQIVGAYGAGIIAASRTIASGLGKR